MDILTRDQSRMGVASRAQAGPLSFPPSSLCLVASHRVANCPAVCRKIETTRHRRCQVVIVAARTRPSSLPVRLNRPGPVQYTVLERKTSTGNQAQTLIVVADKLLCFPLADTCQVATKKGNRLTCFRPNHIPSREAHQSLCGINKKRTTR